MIAKNLTKRSYWQTAMTKDKYRSISRIITELEMTPYLAELLGNSHNLLAAAKELTNLAIESIMNNGAYTDLSTLHDDIIRLLPDGEEESLQETSQEEAG